MKSWFVNATQLLKDRIVRDDNSLLEDGKEPSRD